MQSLELRHRSHARVEDRIRCGKDSGYGRSPPRLFAINQAWLELAFAGIDLLAWTRVLLLDGELAENDKQWPLTRQVPLHDETRYIWDARSRGRLVSAGGQFP